MGGERVFAEKGKVFRSEPSYYTPRQKKQKDYGINETNDPFLRDIHKMFYGRPEYEQAMDEAIRTLEAQKKEKSVSSKAELIHLKENPGSEKQDELKQQYTDAANAMTGTTMNWGGVTITFNKNAIETAMKYDMDIKVYAAKLDKKMIALLKEMIDLFKIESMVVSATYYKAENGTPGAGHDMGLSIDIAVIQFKDDKEMTYIKDEKNSLNEPLAFRKLYDWLVKQDGVRDVYSPWQIKFGSGGNNKSDISDWSKYDKSIYTDNNNHPDKYRMWKHRNHLHLRLW